MGAFCCPQCLMESCVDCHEEGCPGPLAFVPKSYGSLRPDLKMMETMGRRIEALERLVCEGADYLRSIGVTEPKLETRQGRLLAESLLIQKKQTNTERSSSSAAAPGSD